MSTPISVIGTIATDPRFMHPAGGTPLCSFRVASNDRRYDREQGAWVDGETNWFGVTAFRGLADHASRSLRKGDRVVVVGRLRIRQWETDERSGTAVEVDAEALGHDLRWGVSQFAKRIGAAADTPDEERHPRAEPASDSAPDTDSAPNAALPADPMAATPF